MRPQSMGLSIPMFSLCAGRARELQHMYRADTCGNGRNVAEKQEMGFHGHEVSVKTS